MGKIERMQVSEKKDHTRSKGPRESFWISLVPQMFVSLTVAFGSMIVGFASAYSSPALASMSEEESILQPNLDQKSWIGSLLPLFATLGGFLGGTLIAGLGRKRAILITGFPFIASFLMIALAQNLTLVMVGRGLMGLCVGVSTLAYPIYLGETIEAQYRGVLGLMPTTLGNTGVLLSYTAGMFLNWSNLAYLGAILPIPFIICAYIIPETPRWYASKGQLKKSVKALQWLRGREDVMEEFNEIEASQNTKETSKTGIKELFKIAYLKPLLICLFLMLFQQMSGINAIIFYSVDIFKESGSNMDSNIQSIVLGAVNVISTTAATILIDKLGRKILLYLSSFTMIITLALLGLYFKAKQYSDETDTPVMNPLILFEQNSKTNDYGWMPLVCLVVYIIGFSIGFGPVPWLMMGEILPSRIKGVGASLATAFNWACSFVVTKTFGTMTLMLGSDGTFWLYGIFCLLAMVFIKLFVPETKGKSLEDIERMFLQKQDDNIQKINKKNSNKFWANNVAVTSIINANYKNDHLVNSSTNEISKTSGQINIAYEKSKHTNNSKTNSENDKIESIEGNFHSGTSITQATNLHKNSKEDVPSHQIEQINNSNNEEVLSNQIEHSNSKENVSSNQVELTNNSDKEDASSNQVETINSSSKEDVQSHQT